jgi:hypothetical protein
VLVVVVIPVQRPYGLGDVMTRVRYGQLVGSMSAPAREAAADIARTRRGLMALAVRLVFRVDPNDMVSWVRQRDGNLKKSRL